MKPSIVIEILLLPLTMSKKLKIPKIRAAVVDDEPSCRWHLKTQIQSLLPDIEIVFEADSIEQTRAALELHHIDLIFLDVQLKDGNSFELLGELNENTRVIFTTAFNNYAVRAFEVNALDYLLKPIQDDRLLRAYQVYSDKSKQNKTLPLLRPDDDVLLHEQGARKFVPIAEIKYIKSDKDYTYLKTDSRNWFIRRSLSSWEEQLPVTLFLRIHRSYLVNVNHIESVKKASAGRFQLKLNDLTEPITSSRRYGTRLKQVLADYV